MTLGWPSTADEAIAVQEKLAPEVDRTAPAGFAPRTAAGLDVAYAAESNGLAAAVTVLDLGTHEVVDSATHLGENTFPYVPGLFAFRELPSLLDALGRLTVKPDVLVCDGQGLAHPRRFGLACHAGVLTGIPSLGVGKNALGHYEQPGPSRGDWSELRDEGEVVGRALRTRDGVKPVFVSIGHRIDLDTACALVLALTPRFRLPETTRTADRLCRDTLSRNSE